MALCVPNQTGMLHLIPIQSTFAQESEGKKSTFQLADPSRSKFIRFHAVFSKNFMLAHPLGVGAPLENVGSATSFIHRIKASHSCPWSRFKNGANQVLIFL